MRRVPSDPRLWSGSRAGAGRRRTVRSFALFALGSLGTFLMAGRAVMWLGGPVWLAVALAGVGLVLAAWYLVRMLKPRR